MPAFHLATCARPNILALDPYRCARDDYKDNGTNVLLDANENAYGPCLSSIDAAVDADNTATNSAANTASAPPTSSSSSFVQPPVNIDWSGLHRYPDPHQRQLKQLLCDLRNTDTTTAARLTPDNVFVGSGSDEAIDLLIRCFCVPGRDRILTCPPTYGMYAVCARANDVALAPVPLLPAPRFALDVPAITAALSDATDANGGPIKLAYLCSPGNPTGALLDRADIEALLAHPTWNGVVVVDEAYVDFAAADDKGDENVSLAPLVTRYPNLVVLQTLSKAFGLAGVRLGAAFASTEVAGLLAALKAPYNVSTPTSVLACAALTPPGLKAMRARVADLKAQRERLLRELPRVPGVGRLRGGTDANFLLYEVLDPVTRRADNGVARGAYERLAEEEGVVVRFRGRETGCEGCLRVTVGTEGEVERLLVALRRVLGALGWGEKD